MGGMAAEQKQLAKAAQRGEVEKLRGLLAGGGPGAADATNARGETPLHYAAAHGQAGAAAALLDAGAGVNVGQDGGATALHIAVSGGHLEVARLLVARGADPQHRTARGATAVHIAARDGQRALIDWLSGPELGLDLGSETCEGKTPLQYAEEYGHMECAELLRELLAAGGGRGGGGARGNIAPPPPNRAPPPGGAGGGVEGAGGGGWSAPPVPTTYAAAPSPEAGAGSQQLALTSSGLDFGPGGAGASAGGAHMSFGGYYQVPVFFNPPGETAAFLRFREPGLEFHHPWPGRWCALYDNVLFIFADAWSPTPITSVPLEGTSVEPAGMMTGTMFTFVVGRARPMLEGPGMHFEEYFQAGSQYECEQWIAALRACQRATVKARLLEIEAVERAAGGGAGGEEAAEARRKETQEACRRKEERVVTMRKERERREETLRRLRAEHDAVIGKAGVGNGDASASGGVEALQRATLKARSKAKDAERRGEELATQARKAGATLGEARATLRKIEQSVEAEIAAQQQLPATPMLGATGGGGSFGGSFGPGGGPMGGGMMAGGMMGGFR